MYAWMSFPARGNRRRGAIGGSKLAREAVSPRGRGGAAGEARGEWGRGRGGGSEGKLAAVKGKGRDRAEEDEGEGEGE